MAVRFVEMVGEIGNAVGSPVSEGVILSGNEKLIVWGNTASTQDNPIPSNGINSTTPRISGTKRFIFFIKSVHQRRYPM